MTIAILYSLPTERVKKSPYITTEEDTVASAKKISRALLEKNVTPKLIGLSEHTIKETIRGIHAELIINLIDWTGPDLPLGLSAMEELTKCGIPFAGATAKNFSLVDKVTMKKALVASSFPTPQFMVFKRGDEPLPQGFPYPSIVKLAHEHCSIGIEKTSFVKNEQELRRVVHDRMKRFGQDVYAEEFIDGREFQITVLEKEDGPVMLPVAEIVYKPSDKPDFLTFSERWNEDDPDYHRSDTFLSHLTPKQIAVFERISKKVFHTLGFRDFTRIDARLKDGKALMILEANPNPGLDDDELYGMTLSAKAAGMTFSDFIWEIVKSALRRARKTKKASVLE